MAATTDNAGFTILWAVRATPEWTDLHVTEKPSEIVAMMRNDAKGAA